MQPVTPGFAAAVNLSHQIVTQADLWYAGVLVAANLPVTAGKITIDDDAIQRTRATFTVADPSGALVPAAASAAGLSVYGQQVQLRQGLAPRPAGALELVSLGWLRVQQVEISERFRRDHVSGQWVSGGATIDVDAVDRMAAIADARFLAPEQPAAGATCLSEIRRLVTGLLPLAQWPAGLPDPAVPADVTYTESRIDAVAALAAAAGVKVYIDRGGAFTVRALAVAGAPDVTWHGGPDGGLVGIRLTYSRDGVYNAVVASGAATTDQAPVAATAYDTNPNSPTRWDGPFGRVPAFFPSPVITTPAQATAAAQTRLATYLSGRDYTLTVTAVPNPAIEPGTTVARIITPRINVVGRVVRAELPLGPGTASYDVRIAPTAPTRAGDENAG